MKRGYPFGYEMNGHHHQQQGMYEMMAEAASYIGPFHLEVQQVLDEIAGKHFSSTKCTNMEQLCTTLEEAYWDYKDLYVADNPDVFPPLTFKEFVELFFAAGRAEQPPFCNFRSSPREMADWYLKYKRTLNSYGAVLLDSSLKKCVMVRGVGTSLWGFPKGKAKFVPKTRQKEGKENEDASGPSLDMEKETALECAVREVFEELGVDLTDRINEKLTIEWNVGRRKAIFFVIPNVPRGTPFAPQLRNEIEEIAWKPVTHISDLNPHYSGLAEKLIKWIAGYKPAKEETEPNKDGTTAEGDEDEVRPGHAEGQDGYSGIAFKLRRIKDGCKRCPLCGMWFMPGRKLHMILHLKTCAEDELKQFGEQAGSQTLQQPRPQAPSSHQQPPPQQQPVIPMGQPIQPVHQPPVGVAPQWRGTSPPQPFQAPQPSPQQAFFSPPSSAGGPSHNIAPSSPQHPMPTSTQPRMSALQVLQQALQKAVDDRMSKQATHQPSPPPSFHAPSPPSSFGPPQPQHQPWPRPSPPPQHAYPQQGPPPQPTAYQPPPPHQLPYHHGPMPHQLAPPPAQQLPPPQYGQPPQGSFLPPSRQLPQYLPAQPPPPQSAVPPAPQTQLGQTRNQILESLQSLLRGQGP